MISATSPLQGALREAVDGIGHFARGYPIYLEPPDGAETIAATELMRPEPLRHYAARAVKEWSDRPLDEDPRAAVSRLIRRYCGSVATAALAPLAHGIGLDVSPERVRVLMQKDLPWGTVIAVDEVLTSAERPATWPIEGRDAGSIAQLRDAVLAPLFAHFAWAFAAVTASIKVSPQLLWSTAAEQVDLLYENAMDGRHAEVFARARPDRDAALTEKTLPGVDGPNPMLDLLFWEPSDEPPHRIQVRRVCCANFVVPGRTQGYCRNCGLITPARRLEMWDEWRGSVKRGSWSG